MDKFIQSRANAILDGSDRELLTFAQEHLNYRREKGLDFLGRFNNRYIIGEAKFLTDFGGHQNAQFEDAISTIKTKGVKAIMVGILDGVLYIKSRNKMHNFIKKSKYNIMSALVLREFLFQV